MSLIEHAKTELQLAGLFDKEGDFYDGMTGKAVMELIEVFAKQGHSGMSAPYVISIFEKVANFKPLIGITGKDEEWGAVRDLGVGGSWYQNKRCSAIFKDGKDGRPYYIDAIVKRDQNGTCWSGFAWLSEEDYKTGDVICPFSTYTQISADNTSNYFWLYLDNYPTNRTYKIKFRVDDIDQQGVTWSTIIDERYLFEIVD